MLHDLIDDCKTAKLHAIGSIQSYGALVAIDLASSCIVGCSENAGAVIGMSADELLGKPWTPFFTSDELHQLLDHAGPVRHRFWQIDINGHKFYASAHVKEFTAIVEFEPCESPQVYESSRRISFMYDIELMSDPVQVASCLLDRVAEISGFDRVMLYCFLPDWHGHVIDERLKPGVEGFLNLHFPAGDIPENARRLYMINLQRFIADTAEPVVGIRCVDGCTALDMTYSRLRAVHPVHIQYLKNIGARSSFSISIMAAGKLWGMIACHNLEPRMLTFPQRFVCEELSRIASLQISGLLALSMERDRSAMRLELANVVSVLDSSEKSVSSLVGCLPRLMAVFEADSILIEIENQHYAVGAIAGSAALPHLQAWLSSQEKQQLWHTNSFPQFLQQHSGLQKLASGLLLIPLSNGSGILLLRNEQVENQQWAGKQPGLESSTLQQLTPRSSFEMWAKETAGTAAVWTTVQLEMAAEFNHSLSAFLEHLRVEKLAMEDSLTGLPNRRSFETCLRRAIANHGRQNTSFAVFMMDLDKFKVVNDTLGHAAGDELLREVSSRLKKAIREGDVIARLGGDEFALIQDNISRPGDYELVASRILEEIYRPCSIHGSEIRIGISIGIALYPSNSIDANELLAKADSALYAVKSSGRNNWRLFS